MKKTGSGAGSARGSCPRATAAARRPVRRCLTSTAWRGRGDAGARQLRIRRRERREDDEEHAAFPEDAQRAGRRRRGEEAPAPERSEREAARAGGRAVADRRADVLRRDAVLQHHVEGRERHLSRERHARVGQEQADPRGLVASRMRGEDGRYHNGTPPSRRP